MNAEHVRPWDAVGFVIALLLAVTAGAGLFVTDFYRPFLESQLLLAGAIVQDAVSLGVAVALVSVIIRARRGSLRAFVVWNGLLLYTLYYYSFYAIDEVYTPLYPLYLALMGLAAYSLLGLLSRVDLVEFTRHMRPSLPARWISLVLGMAILFVPLWLTMVVSTIRTQTGHPFTTVFVLDLAFLIPAMVIAAVQLWRRRPSGYLLAGVLLVKSAISGLLLTVGSLWQIQLGFPVAMEELGMYLFLLTAGGLALAVFLSHLCNEVSPERFPARPAV